MADSLVRGYGYFVDWNGNGLFDGPYADISAYVLASSWQHGFPNGPRERANAGS